MGEQHQPLVEAFHREPVVVIPPIEFRSDRTMRLTVIGESDELQAAIDELPAGIDVDILRIGGYTDVFNGRLTERSQDYTDPLIRSSETDLDNAGVRRVPRTDGVVDGKPRVADGRVLDVAAVDWATGFRPAFDWIELSTPIFEPDGFPIYHRGVVDSVPGLYFLGLPAQSTVLSATIGGVCLDARYIADHLRSEIDAESRSNRVAAGQRATCPTDIRQLLGLR